MQPVSAGRALSWLGLTLLACAPLATALASRSPAAIAPAFGLVALAWLLLRQEGLGLDRAVLGLILAFLAIMAVVSITAEGGWTASSTLALKSAGLIAAGLFGTAFARASGVAARPAAKIMLAACFAAALAILWLDGAADGTVYRLARGLAPDAAVDGWTYDRTAVVLAILLWPTIACLPGGWMSIAASIAASALLLGAILFTESQTGPVVVVLSLAAYLLARLWPRLVAVLTGAASALYIAAAPWLFIAVHERGTAFFGRWDAASAGARLDIWKVVSELALERPLTGWGLGALRSLDGIFGADEPFMTAAGHTGARHAHNNALQLWLDLGLAGVIIAIALVSLAFWHLRTLSPPSAAAGTAMLVAILVVGSLYAGLWQGWWLGTIALALCQFMAARRTKDPFAIDQFGAADEG